MLLTLGELKHRLQGDMGGLVRELQEITGRYGRNEEEAWRSSLPKLTAAFAAPSFDPLHLYFGGKGNLALEYQLPASSSWCDLVLLGSNSQRPSVVIIELKDWQTRADRPGTVEGLIERFGEPVLHPSDQVRGYAEYCRRFHSAVHDFGADVFGCVLFTKDYFVQSYRLAPNASLADAYPCFTLSPKDTGEVLPAYFSQHLSRPHEPFATAFERGTYKQDRGFIRQIGQQIADPKANHFELLDNQRRAFSLVRSRINDSVFGTDGEIRKQVIIVDGPPGSGKSVLAAKLWAALVTDPNLPEGSAVFTTTSSSQYSNWRHLFREAANDAGAVGVVKRATGYTPITNNALGRLRRLHGPTFLSDVDNWRENVRTVRNLGMPFEDGAQDDQFLVSIVDEAHALINPEQPEGRGQYGFVVTLGPQAYHIIRSSTVTVFLLDAQQSFRDRENTTVEDIKTWAHELNATVTSEISLAGTQFRCAGSKEYVEWAEGVLRGESPEVLRVLSKSWMSLLDFRIFENPAELEAALRRQLDAGRTARLLASYARKWKTQGAALPHDLPDNLKDFHEVYDVGGTRKHWSRIWNFVPRGTDYTQYIQARSGSRMHADPLCEVGCPYAVRGFDFDYVGLLWLSDLRRRNGGWEVDIEQVYESGLVSTLRTARRESDAQGAAHMRLREALAQGYRILMTRPMRGIYVWFEDQDTRRYLESCIA